MPANQRQQPLKPCRKAALRGDDRGVPGHWAAGRGRRGGSGLRGSAASFDADRIPITVSLVMTKQP